MTTTAGPLGATRAVLGGGGFGGLGSRLQFRGTGLDEAGAHDVLSRCLDLGITMVDTAHSYADGDSQRMIGSWFGQDPTRRERMRVLDKVGAVQGADGPRIDLSRDNTQAQCADALQRMGLDRVTIVSIHAPDENTPAAETAAVFAEAISQGRAETWGLSNVNIAVLTEWLDAADRLGLPDPAIIENGHNLLERSGNSDVLALCRERGITFLAYSPLAAGVLTGKYEVGRPPPEGSIRAMAPELTAPVDAISEAVVARLRQVGAEHDAPPAAVALAWVMAQPGVLPIVGASRASHLEAIATALDLSLTPEELALLEEPTAG